MPLVSRTRATLRRAEFGFFGVFVYTRVHTPRRWGEPLSAAVFVLDDLDSRPLRTSCWIVGTDEPSWSELGVNGHGRGRVAHQAEGQWYGAKALVGNLVSRTAGHPAGRPDPRARRRSSRRRCPAAPSGR